MPKPTPENDDGAEPSDGRVEELELASFLRDNLDAIVKICNIGYPKKYPHSKYGKLDNEIRDQWTESLFIDLINQLESGQVDPYWFHRNKSGDIIVNVDPLVASLATTVETLLFYGTMVAPVLWQHYAYDPQKRASLRDTYEKFIQSVIRANTETFLDEICGYSALSRTWDFHPEYFDESSSLFSGDGAEKEATPNARPTDGFSEARLGAAGLTEREQEIARLVWDGKSNKEIAQCLHMQEGTVKNHMSHIFDKLGVSNRTSMIVKLMAEGAKGDGNVSA